MRAYKGNIVWIVSGLLLGQVSAVAEPASVEQESFMSNPDLAAPPGTPRSVKPYSGRVAYYSGAVKTMSGSVRNLGGVLKDLVGSNKNLKFSENETTYTISMSSDVFFDFDKSTLRPEAEKVLGELAQVFRDGDVHSVMLIGHTDSKGEEDYNRLLSRRRAEAVADWLSISGGLSSLKYRVKGEGESKPIAPNSKPDGSDDPEGRQRNRRVDILVSKSD